MHSLFIFTLNNNGSYVHVIVFVLNFIGTISKLSRFFVLKDNKQC